ncbi:MAG: alpha/beta hydrolase [Bacilli bacterium]|nr:alpha/beta hydrolase [Bacilli bacterium]
MEETKRKRKSPLFVISIVIAALVLTYFGSGVIAANIVSSVLYGHRLTTPKNLQSKWYALFNTREDYEVLSNREVLTFPSNNNETLSSYFYSSSSPKGTVISLHGMGSLADGDNSEYQQWFVEKGYNLLALDLTASGNSEGNEMRGLHQSAYDAYSAYSYLIKEKRIVEPLIMAGHSWGAYGAAASLSLGVKANYVISFSGYDVPIKEMYAQAESKVGILAPLTYPAFLLGMELRFGGNGTLSAKEAIANSSAKALLIHGDADNTVSYDISLLDAAKDLSNVTTLTIPGCGHDRPWLEMEAKEYANGFIAKLGKDFDSLDKERATEELTKLGYEKEKANILNKEVFSAIEKLLAK